MEYFGKLIRRREDLLRVLIERVGLNEQVMGFEVVEFHEVLPFFI